MAASELACARMAAKEGLHCTSARLSELRRRLSENSGNVFSLRDVYKRQGENGSI
ncbi:hypothetical protein DEO72_LG5g2453 [Vigna unguiculata]|uniref:Uncharacterized protein n=1 Tax=Vigna unguiculata TaxID=3917 RepID=A0A4D6M0I1_VIGUN|nr:hypothetical protein DEO72_LG5g2453 [Vigna unguiculata]